MLLDSPKCSYKDPKRLYGAVGEKLLLLCDMQPFSGPLEFNWTFLGNFVIYIYKICGNTLNVMSKYNNTTYILCTYTYTFYYQFSSDSYLIYSGISGHSKNEHLKTSSQEQKNMMADAAEDQLSYFIKDEQAFGKIVCSAKTLDENLLEGNPCEFEVVPKGNQTYFLVVMVGMISFFFTLLISTSSKPLPTFTKCHKYDKCHITCSELIIFLLFHQLFPKYAKRFLSKLYFAKPHYNSSYFKNPISDPFPKWLI